MSAAQTVFAAVSAAVVVSIALITAGMAILAGVGWCLITAGALIGPTSIAAAVALLRDGSTG